MRIALPLIAAALAATLAPLPAQASSYKDFRDWWAACDNLRNCSAYGFDTEMSGGTYLRIERGGAPDAQPEITVTTDVGEGVTFRLSFDDPALPGLPADLLQSEEGEGHGLRRAQIGAGQGETLIASLRKAKQLIVTRVDPPGRKSDPVVSRVSLNGAVAALLWIDDQQKRLGTTTALIRRGDKPASTIPPQPTAPAIIPANGLTGDAADKKPSPRDEAAVKKKGLQLCGEGDKGEFDSATALSADTWLYGFRCPDSSGAYNFAYTFLIAKAGQSQSARAAQFRWPVKIGDAQNDAGNDAFVINADFSNADMTMRTFSKGRGIGDCGTEQSWVFDGKAFRLAELKMMANCKGVPADDWPTLYRADVKK